MSRDLPTVAIAKLHAGRLDTISDQLLFMDTFARVRTVAPALADRPLDLETLCVGLMRGIPVMEAAMIEALASLRAEGMTL